MREILFKAKRKDNGKWVEGYYYESKISGCYILTPKLKVRKKDGIIIGDSFDVYEVDPETVCQYINENDKDNTMIFENDIVEIPTFKPQCMVIRFLDGAFCLTDKEGKYVADIYYIHHAGINNTKVIGNIFDNPDLLEVERC